MALQDGTRISQSVSWTGSAGYVDCFSVKHGNFILYSRLFIDEQGIR